MGTPITSFELQRRLDIAKRREAAREAARRAATPKPYTPKDVGGTAYFRSIENENLFVEMPIPGKAGTLATTAVGSIGGYTLAEVNAMTPKPATVAFKGNHKEVLRVRFTRLKATPTTKITSWGTRVVDHIDDSVTVPFGGNTDCSLKDAAAAFNTFVTSGPGAAALGTKKGNKVELIFNNKVITRKVV
jgi:hypothetical protein